LPAAKEVEKAYRASLDALVRKDETAPLEPLEEVRNKGRGGRDDA
jgi:hypothetical protein